MTRLRSAVPFLVSAAELGTNEEALLEGMPEAIPQIVDESTPKGSLSHELCKSTCHPLGRLPKRAANAALSLFTKQAFRLVLCNIPGLA